MRLAARYARELARRGYAADPAQHAAIAALEELGSRLAQPRARRWFAAPHAAAGVRGLYLWGGVGRGKTFLMDLFFESLPFAERRRRHFHRFMHDVHAQLHIAAHKRAPLEHVAAQIAREARVLCFDELFVSDIADAMIIAGLLRGLFRRGVVLVATSNVPPGRLYENGLQRARFVPAIALLERHTQVLQVDGGTDYRLRDLTAAGIYFVSAAAAAEAQMAALFEKFAIAGTPQRDAVHVNGRPIPVLAESGTAIWFEFAVLCADPRSQDDYIEIARAYQAVFLAGVPTFDAEHENEARRFIALVDEFYDRSVKLIVSAAAHPPQLYCGERLQLEFARAASRLIEMQSQEYLARAHRP